MTPILLNQLRSIITSPLISLFCKKYEENETLLKKSIDTSICTVLIGIDNIIENPSLYDKINDAIRTSEFYKTIEYNNGKISSINYSFEKEGINLLNYIFSTKKGRISEMVSNEVGIKSETAGAVLNFTVMLTLAHFINEKQNITDVQAYLNSERKILLNIIPDGIRIILGYPIFEYENAHNNTDTLASTKIKKHFFSKLFRL
jgi:hypothetical protein